MADQNDATSQQEGEKKNELRLKLLKDEIASQANTFDQIDSKTGVALGFTFVVVGQVLASVFRIATDQSHLQSSHTALTTFVFVAANCLAVAAIISGIGARWPRSFLNTVEFSATELEGSYDDMIKSTIESLNVVTSRNDAINLSKGRWALATYLLVAAALIGYLGLTIILYNFSIPRSDQKNGPVSTTVKVPPARVDAGTPQEGCPKIQSIIPATLTPQTTTVKREGSRQRTAPGGQGTTSLQGKSEIEQKLKSIIVEQLQVDESQVTPNANFKQDLGADDLDVVELVMQLEEAFNLEIPDKDAKRLNSVKETVSYIEQHISQRPEK
jgi:acyl carrier protein